MITNEGCVLFFTDPDDPTWKIWKSDFLRSIWIGHDCHKSVCGHTPGQIWYMGSCCMYCGDEYPPKLHGFFKLVRWSYESEER